MSSTDSAVSAWFLCPNCATPIYRKRWNSNLRVCPECGRHDPLSARQRLDHLCDPGWRELPSAGDDEYDPLGFVDTLRYPDRLAQARRRTGLREAVLSARGEICAQPVVAAVMDFRFLGGSLGTVVGAEIVRAARVALADRTPLLVVTSSGGARMQEGAVALMQMATTSAALAELSEAGILTVSLITDPTFGGVAASFATSTDIIIAEPGARLGFAGRRVIEQTIGQQLPPDFQTAEFLAGRGYLDLVVPRRELRHKLSRLLTVGACAGRRTTLKPAGDSVAAEGTTTSTVVTEPHQLSDVDPWEQVRAARDLRRPTASDYLGLVFDDFQQVYGDRLTGDCSAVVVGFGWLAGQPVAVAAHQKGHTPAELAERNFGMPSPAGYRKAARLMRLADKLGLPVVTLIDTPGAYPGASAEEQGQAFAIAANLHLMSSLRVPSVAVIIGEGGSGGALALAVSNRVLILENGIYSVISPEGCAAILWKDAAAAPRAAAALGLTAASLLRSGVVDGVVPEPPGGAGADHAAAAANLRNGLLDCLTDLVGLSGDELLADRRSRFRRFSPVLG